MIKVKNVDSYPSTTYFPVLLIYYTVSLQRLLHYLCRNVYCVIVLLCLVCNSLGIISFKLITTELHVRHMLYAISYMLYAMCTVLCTACMYMKRFYFFYARHSEYVCVRSLLYLCVPVCV